MNRSVHVLGLTVPAGEEKTWTGRNARDSGACSGGLEELVKKARRRYCGYRLLRLKIAGCVTSIMMCVETGQVALRGRAASSLMETPACQRGVLSQKLVFP